LLELIVTCVEVLVPLHAPLQPAKTDPDAADAVKVTTVPRVYVWVQSEPQLIPAGFEVTVPLPEPAFVTVRVAPIGGVGLNSAVHVLAELIVTCVVRPEPAQSPPQL